MGPRAGPAVSTGRSRRSHERRTNPWTAGWSVLLPCVLLLAPSPARAENEQCGTADPQPADFRAMDAYVTEQIEAMHIPGVAVGVVRGDQIVHVRWFGVAGPDSRAMTAQTPLVLGSASKSFTALAGQDPAVARRVFRATACQGELGWAFQVRRAESPRRSPDVVRTAHQFRPYLRVTRTEGRVWAKTPGTRSG